MKTTKEILVEARGYIAEPGSWTKGSFARDGHGNHVSKDSHRASCFCAAGAIGRAAKGSEREQHGALRALRSAITGPITAWNDAPNRTHAEVLAAFDRAIEIAGAE